MTDETHWAQEESIKLVASCFFSNCPLRNNCAQGQAIMQALAKTMGGTDQLKKFIQELNHKNEYFAICHYPL
jgi:hypothetical protein